MSNLVEFKNVSFSYTEAKPIIKNINLVIPKGSVVAIMGGSGCGKTTLLKLISAQIFPDKGEVEVFNAKTKTANHKSIYAIRKKMGMLFQFGALFTDMSVGQNVAFPIKEHTNLHYKEVNLKVSQKLEAVGLFGTQGLMPQELSGGMARRVALARAIALDPELMLYDEPFTGLDPISLNIAAKLIKQLSQEHNQSAVLVTHDIEATMKIADYMYFMSQGEIIAEGTPEEIKKTQNPSVQQFITGAIDGPFSFKYQTSINYEEYIKSCL